MKSEFVRARVSSELKHDSEIVLAKLGMSVSDAIRIFLTQVSLRNEFPVELKVPNEITQKAMNEPLDETVYESSNELFCDVLGDKHAQN